MVPGLAVGDRCADCARRLSRRASQIGRWAAMGTTVPLAVYITLTLPTDRSARLVASTVVVIWYVLTFLIAKRVAWEWLK